MRKERGGPAQEEAAWIDDRQNSWRPPPAWASRKASFILSPLASLEGALRGRLVATLVLVVGPPLSTAERERRKRIQRICLLEEREGAPVG